METWILIWTLVVGNYQYSHMGVAAVTHSQEFNSKANCEFAMQRMLDSIEVGLLIVGCYPK